MNSLSILANLVLINCLVGLIGLDEWFSWSSILRDSW